MRKIMVCCIYVLDSMHDNRWEGEKEEEKEKEKEDKTKTEEKTKKEEKPKPSTAQKVEELHVDS